MVDKLPIDTIVALPAATCKYLLIKCFHPETKDAEAGRLSGYKGKSGGTLKARVAGVLGPYLDAEGISVESIAEVMREALNATKYKEVLLKDKVSTGVGKARKIELTHKVETVDLGPDHKVRLQAGAMLINLHMAGEKKVPPALPAPEEEPEDAPVEMSVEELEAAVNRGPREVIEADFEEVKEPDVSTG